MIAARHAEKTASLSVGSIASLDVDPTDPEKDLMTAPDASTGLSPDPAAAERELVTQAIAGDREAFGRLVTRHAAMVTGVAYAILGDFARSEDAGQEAFIEAWRKRSTLRDPGRFVAWVCQIARNRAIDLHRRAKRTESPTERLDGTASGSEQTADELVANDEQKKLIWATLDRLPDETRETMVLFYRGEQSTAEVADALGESEPTIRKRLSRGRAMLRLEIESLVGTALRQSAPRAAFAAVVLSSLPQTASAAATTGATGTAASGAVATGAAAVGAKATGGVWAKVMSFFTGAGGAGTFGASVGLFGGLLGGGLGLWATYKASPYRAQRRMWIAMGVAMLIWMIIVTVVTADYIRGELQQTLTREQLQWRYAWIMAGSQLSLWVLIGIAFWLHRWIQRREFTAGTPQVAGFKSQIERAAAADRKPYVRTSTIVLWGLPLYEIRSGDLFADEFGNERARPARGWVALGDRAYGGLFAAGGFAAAPVCCGGLAIGGVAIGGAAIGVLGLGGGSIGLMAIGGGSIALAAWGNGGFSLYGSGSGLGVATLFGSLADGAEAGGLLGFLCRIVQVLTPWA